MRFKLAEGDRLVLMSDGIVEAMDAEGHLFGFDRVHELLRKGTVALRWPVPRRASARRTTSASSP